MVKYSEADLRQLAVDDLESLDEIAARWLYQQGCDDEAVFNSVIHNADKTTRFRPTTAGRHMLVLVGTHKLIISLGANEDCARCTTADGGIVVAHSNIHVAVVILSILIMQGEVRK